VGALARPLQLEAGAPAHHFLAVVDEVLDQLAQE